MGGSIGILVGSCGYGLLLLGWFVLYRCFGDTRWPLALAAPFAPLFFLPLLVQIWRCILASIPNCLGELGRNCAAAGYLSVAIC